MTDLNARDFINSSFIKKEELRASGPRRLMIKTVEQGEGLPGRSGQPARQELQLVFTDDSRFSLRAQVNLKRVIEAYGDHTSKWVGKSVELYLSPDVNNPTPGGIRLRVREATAAAPAAGTFVSELEQSPF